MPARPPAYASDPVPVRQPADSLHASFSPDLTVETLRFAWIPATWSPEDSHLQVSAHAGRTRYASGRFEAFAWHKAPDEGHDIAGALLRLALDLERQLQGFTMAHVVDRADEFIAWLPRLTELLEQRSILIVLDNLESLLTPEGSWRDARWEAMVRALLAHGGFSRTVLTSRRRPVAFGDDPRLVVEAIHALSLAESALLARELPHLVQ